MGQIGRHQGAAGAPGRRSAAGAPGRRSAAGAALLVVAAPAAALTLGGCGSSPADASSVLRAASQVRIVQPDGTSISGRAGTVLHAGDEVRVGRHGRATVATGGRQEYLLPSAALVVRGPQDQTLEHGVVVVDARDGAALRLTAGGDDVAVASGSAARVVRGVRLDVGALAGPVAVANGAGARLTVAALHEVALGGDALPTSTVALRLTDDRAEGDAVPDLVRDDELLRTLARGIDATGATSVTADAAWRTGAAVDATRRTPLSDRVLPVVLAHTGGQPSSTAYRDAVRWRSQGGSWGVIAHLLGASAASAAGELAALQAAPGGLGRVALAAAAAAGAPGAGRGAGGGTGPGPAGPGGGTGPSPAPTSGGGGRPSPSPAPSPSPSGGPVRTVTGGVGRTVHKVLKHLPVPATSLLPTALPLLPKIDVNPLSPQRPQCHIAGRGDSAGRGTERGSGGSALDVAADEGLDGVASLVVAVLHRR